jgi:predicted metal-dependent hydrolase
LVPVEELTLFSEVAAPDRQPEPEIEIRVSARRRKSVAAHWEGDRIVVIVPQRMSKRERRSYAEELAARLTAERDRRRPTDERLTARAIELSIRYLDGRALPAAVTWSSRQHHRWGSCSLADRTIRISKRLAEVPDWVLDAVLVHELAHLLRGDHDDVFDELVGRYPRTADAALFLEGLQHGLEMGREGLGSPAQNS